MNRKTVAILSAVAVTLAGCGASEYHVTTVSIAQFHHELRTGGTGPAIIHGCSPTASGYTACTITRPDGETVHLIVKASTRELFHAYFACPHPRRCVGG